MKTGFPSQAMAWVAALCAVVSVAAPVVSAATANDPETWTAGGKEGWHGLNYATGLYEDVALRWTNGYVALDYPAQSAADPRQWYAAVADAGASGGRFTGDVFDAGAWALRFDFYGSEVPELAVSLWNTEGFILYEAAVNVVTGWQTVEIPLDTAHFRPPAGVPDETDFESLLAQVDEVWINIRRAPALSAQQYRLDNVEWVGAGAGYGAWITPFGGTFYERLPAVDRDEDGAINGEECIADTNPSDKDERLRLRCGAVPYSLSWDGSTNRLYTLERCDDLGAGLFDPVLVRRQGAGPGDGYTDNGAGPAAVYRLRVERP